MPPYRPASSQTNPATDGSSDSHFLLTSGEIRQAHTSRRWMFVSISKFVGALPTKRSTGWPPYNLQEKRVRDFIRLCRILTNMWKLARFTGLVESIIKVLMNSRYVLCWEEFAVTSVGNIFVANESNAMVRLVLEPFDKINSCTSWYGT